MLTNYPNYADHPWLFGIIWRAWQQGLFEELWEIPIIYMDPEKIPH